MKRASTILTISCILLVINLSTFSSVASAFDGTVDGGTMTETTTGVRIDGPGNIEFRGNLSTPAGFTVDIYALNALLRDITGSATIANGIYTLYGPGTLAMINPAGFIFGSTAQVNAANIIVSTLNISTNDFFDGCGTGTFRFTGQGAYIINHGKLISQPGGYVCLLSQAIKNTGTIQAALGKIILASGEKMTLALDDLGTISVVVDEAVKSEIFGPDGQKIKSGIENTEDGVISANGGTVTLTAKSLNRVFDYAINNSGIIEAKSLNEVNGEIVLSGEGAPIINTDTIKANKVDIDAINSDFFNYGSVIAEGSRAGAGEVFINAVNIWQGGLIAADRSVNIDADGLFADPKIILPIEPDSIGPIIVLNPDPPFTIPEAIIPVIRAPIVNIRANTIGIYEYPVNINAGLTYIYKMAGNIDILESLGIGTSILLRGPPGSGFSIIYSEDSDLTLDSAGSVNIIGTDPIYLYGNITFYDFTCTIPNKTIYFEAGKAYTFIGTFKIQGAYAQHVKLLSSQKGTQWYIDPRGGRDITYAWIEDSYNMNPSEIVMTESTNRGNSFNWDPTGTWTGAISSLWSVAGNWSGLGGATPGAGDDVLFNGGSVVDSTVDAAFGGTIRDITIAAGYTGTITLARSLSARDFSQAAGTFNAGAQTLTVTRDFALSGGIFNAGSGSLSVADDFTISGTGVFNEGTGTVKFTGGAATINVLVTETFYNLVFAPTTAGANKTISNNDTLIVSGTLTLTEGNINQGTTPSSGTISAQGDIVQESTFDGGTGLIIITGTANQTFTGNATASAGDLPDLTINKTGGTLVLAGIIRINGQGAGAWTYIAGTVDATTNDSTVIFNNANTIDGQGTSSTMAFDNIEFRGGTAKLAGDLNVDGNLTIVSGATLDVSTSNYGVAVGGNWVNNGTFTERSGTVTFDGTGTQTLDSGGTGASKRFNNIVCSGSGTLQIITNDVTLNGDLTVLSGTLDPNGRVITGNGTNTLIVTGTILVDAAVFAGSYASFETRTFNAGSTVNYSRSGAQTIDNTLTYSNLTTSGSGTKTLGGAIAVNNNLTIGAGTTLDVSTSNYGIDLSGNWTNNGTFVPRSGTVTFNDNTKTSSISGSTTFNNFTCVTAGKILSFAAGSTQTMTGTLTLTGAAGNLVVLKSSAAGTRWNIDPQGTRNVSFVDAQDSNNINAAQIPAPNSKDSGNDANWNLVDHFTVTGITSPQAAGALSSPVITAIDGVGGISTSYTGTIHFTSNDAAAILPADYTFTSGAGQDNGTRTFANGVTLNTITATGSVTVTDTVSLATGAQAGIIVNAVPAAPATPGGTTFTDPALLVEELTRRIGQDTFTVFNNYRLVSVNINHPFFYFYHPLTPIDQSLFTDIALDADAYEFIENSIELKKHAAPYYGI